MKGASIVATAVVNRYGMTIRLVSWQKKIFAVAFDVVRCLGLGRNNFTGRISRQLSAFQGQVAKIKVENAPAPYWVMSEWACREYVCGLGGAKDALLIEDFLEWLEKGGMQLDEQLPLPGVQEIALEEIELTVVEDQPKAPILALVPSKLPPVPSEQQERARAYCRELLKTLLRYANDEEAEHLVHVVEAEVYGVLNVRYCQGLNDARYELYRRFWLQGGAK